MLLSPRAVLAVPAVLVAGVLLTTCTGDRSIGPRGPAGPGVLASVGSVVGQVLVGAGDIARCDRQNDEATAALLDTIPGSVFTVGDNVLGGSNNPPDFVNCYGPSWGRHKARTRPTIGHMEGFSSGSATYTQYFGAAAGDPGKFYYSYDLGGWHIVVLNSGISTAAGSTQEQWLKADLAAHPVQCTLAMWHVPRFSSTSSNGLPAVNDAVKPLWDDLYAAGAEIVINSHYEVYERFAPQKPSGAADAQIGIRQFTVGTGGIGVNSFNGGTAPNSEVHNSGTPGVLKLTLGSNGYAWQFIPIAQFTFTDAGTGDCHGNTPGPAVASVDVTPNPASVEVGLDVQLTATPKDAAGNPLPDRLVSWTSSNTAVAKVSGGGDVFGWAEGTATITATSDGVNGTSTVTVVSTTAAVLVGAGDIAVCDSPEDEATAALLDNIQGTVFTAGDNAYPDGSATQFTNCYGPSWGRHKARTKPVAGNHDYTTAGAPAYYSYFGAAAGDPTKGYYSFDLGAWHVIAINNYVDASADSPQEQWLKADLAASSKQCTAAIWHEPTFSSGILHGHNSDWLALWQDLYQAGAEIIITGHEHTYERFAPMTPNGVADPTTGIREFVVGTGGAGLEALGTIQPNSEVVQNSAHGVLRLVLRPTGYQWRFFPEAGQVFSDTGSAPCHGPPGNQPPTASFTSSCTGLTCHFTDTSIDPDGSVVAWSWSFGDGATATVANPSHTYAAGGTYTVSLTVTDNSGGTGSTSQSITVTPPNTPPTAAFTQSCTGLACSFTSTSTDPDGTVVGWSWSFGDGATATIANPSHPYAAGGTYTVSLTVTDNSGGTGFTSQSITVAPANTSPTAAFTQSCTGLSCSFTSTSTDPDGTVVAWSWSFGDGATATVANPSHTYAAGGTYTVSLTVTDNSGGTGSTSHGVTVTPPNQLPTAAFTRSCTGLACSFTSTSTDPDGTVVGWSWSFGDGATATVANPSHTYAAGGTYTVRLTVTDNSGGTGSTSQSVTVTAPNLPPTASFTKACGDLSCSFTSTSTDPDGSVVAWSWNFGDGATATVANPSHTYAAGGTYTVSLTVTDNAGATNTTSQAVTVTAPIGAQVLVGAGDIARCDRQNDEATAALLDGISGAVFTVGDNVLGGSTSPPDFVNCYDPSWGRHKARTRPATGHMEGFSPGSATYTQYFGAAAGDPGKFYYSYDVGSWHVVVLNSNISMSAGSPQELWLRADLTAHPTQCALAIWHLPRFSSTSSSGLPVVNAAVKPLWDDLYAAGAEIVINAHYEVYERFAPQTSSGTADPQLGIRQFTVGTGGIGVNNFGGGTAANSEVHNSGTPGVLKLTLAANSYSWQFIPIAGLSFTDSGSGACH